MSSAQLLIRTSLDYLAVQTGLDLFVTHDCEGRWLLGKFYGDNEAQPDDGPDATLIAPELEYNRLCEADYKSETETGQEALDRA